MLYDQLHRGGAGVTSAALLNIYGEEALKTVVPMINKNNHLTQLFQGANKATFWKIDETRR